MTILYAVMKILKMTHWRRSAMARVNSDIDTKQFIDNDVSAVEKPFDDMLDKVREKKDPDPADDLYNVQQYIQQYLAVSLASGGRKTEHNRTDKLFSSHNSEEHVYRLKPGADRLGLNSGLSISQQLQSRDCKEVKNSVQANSSVLTMDKSNSDKLSKHIGGLEEKEEFTTLKSHFSVPPAHGDSASLGEDTISRGENMHRSRTQQLIKFANEAASLSEVRVDKQDVNLVYQFQRWTGDHSVKVSIPFDSSSGNITLLPSDARVADALSRNMDRTIHRMSDLLLQQHDKDERQHHQDEEDKE
ncbi:hypothetical protein EJP617_27290 [Erwinia sp. Ejp617]|nr:hypothetical protein EJP617_27290 [Erwinia sp. Ejp617]